MLILIRELDLPGLLILYTVVCQIYFALTGSNSSGYNFRQLWQQRSTLSSCRYLTIKMIMLYCWTTASSALASATPFYNMKHKDNLMFRSTQLACIQTEKKLRFALYGHSSSCKASPFFIWRGCQELFQRTRKRVPVLVLCTM